MSNVEERFNRKNASIIMALMTLVAPYTVFLNGYTFSDGQSSMSTTIYALFWGLYPPETGMGGLQVLTFFTLTAGLSLGFFNIIFAIQVIRYVRGETGRKSTLVAGVLTLVLPIISLIIALPFMLSSEIFVYIGPIPIQLVTGLLLMHFAGPKEITSPW